MDTTPVADGSDAPRSDPAWTGTGSVVNRFALKVSSRMVATAIRAVYPRVEPELARVADFVPRGGTAVDVGGWLGPWTERLVPLADRVVTIEAVPVLADLLRRSFPEVRIVQAVASDACGTGEIWIPAAGPYVGISSVETTSGTPVGVPRITLDSLELTDVRFIKMDIEGHELAALHGARKTITRDRPLVLLEVEERHRPAPVLDLMASWGYTGRVLVGKRWTPLDEFDLFGHQRATIGQIERSLVSRVVWPGRRYINAVLFDPPGS